MPNTKSGRFAVVVPQHSAQSLPAHHFTRRAANFFAGLYQPVAEPLMVTLCMKMEDEFSNGFEQSRFPEEDQPMEALVLDRSHEAFEIRTQIWRTGR